jgi:hypothetical protein
MLDNEKTAMLADDLAALDLAHRREVATEWRTAAETFAGVPDGNQYCSLTMELRQCSQITRLRNLGTQRVGTP